MEDYGLKELFKDKNSRQKVYRVQGAIMFGVALGLLLMRLIIWFLPIENEILLDALFTIPLQVGVLVIMPWLVYKFVLKMNCRQVLAFSNFRKTKWYNFLLIIPITIGFYFFTILVSSIWQMLLTSLGYTHGTGSPLPEQFSIWLLLANILLTGVLPGICEEFCNRGGFLSTIRSSFPIVTTVIIMGVAFGLFHQNITQIFYTMFFGAFAAFLTLKLKSIWPAILMHFLNNSISVVGEFAYAYDFAGGGLNGLIDRLNATGNGLALYGIIAFFMIIAAVSIFIMIKLNSKKKVSLSYGMPMSTDMQNNQPQPGQYNQPQQGQYNQPQPGQYNQPQQGQYNQPQQGQYNQPQQGQYNQSQQGQYNQPPSPYPMPYGMPMLPPKPLEDLYKPTLKDNAFFIAAIVTAALTTIFTFVFGFIV